MASIDKTYTSKFSEYKELKEWVKSLSYFLNYAYLSYGIKKIPITIKNYLYQYEESDFDGAEIPVLNTPTWADALLWKYCDIYFVKNRLQEVYNEGYLDEIEVGVIPADFKQGRNITIHFDENSKYSFHNKPWDIKYWRVQSNSDLWYNDDFDFWANDNYFPTNTNTMHGKTIKSIVRRLRKMYLPSGIEFTVSGKYIGEQFKIKAK